MIHPGLELLLKEYKTKRSQAKSAYNKYKRLQKQLAFVDAIVRPKQSKSSNVEDDDLAVAIRMLFTSLGYPTASPQNKDNFDLIITTKSNSIGVEVKNGKLPKENELFQAHKYRMRHNFKGPVITIWNNAGQRYDFDSNRQKDALINGYGILTTTELRRGYLMLVNNSIDQEMFLSKLCNFGEIRFT